MDIILGRIISLIVFQISVTNLGIILKKKSCSRLYEKGIFYGAVYRKVCGIFLYAYNERQTAAWEYNLFPNGFLFIRRDYENL